ncbi:MAG: tRNA (adenosine(37)-N6)-threonylcarbamoyltransferase complex dimerization subunit type 1 TsaB [Verrucomicrobia bacterium]|nr:tRNA (adenosine(37)-N6)-threonylcarbamoyltransferase complex dimerization subunit type 1 TsaB [Verrucomicrobiota bacterium]
MKILALEFSSAQRSVAVVEGGTDHLPVVLVEMVEAGGRATRALGLIEEVLKLSRVEREQIDCLAVGLGPGSYNGIRAAIALAQGWQLATGMRILGVSSAECLAAQAQEQGCFGKVNIVIDAQRKEFYLASYEIGDAVRREVERLRLASPGEVEAKMKSGEMVVGPEVKRWFPASREIFPAAAVLGRLAAGRRDFISGEKLEPIYLRESNFVKALPPRVIPTIPKP